MTLAFPKPKDQKKAKAEAVVIRKSGREVCNLNIKAGRDEYRGRIRQMWERQSRRCKLEKLVSGCPGKLRLDEATFDHDEGRGMGGANRDDRIVVIDAKTGAITWINGAAHYLCNSCKGSVRLSALLAFELGDVP